MTDRALHYYFWINPDVSETVRCNSKSVEELPLTPSCTQGVSAPTLSYANMWESFCWEVP